MKPAFIQSAAAILIWLLGAPSLALAQSPTTTTLTSSPNPSDIGQAVTMTATVKGQGGGMPAGSITFKEGSNTIGNVALELASRKALASQIGLGSNHGCALTTNGGGVCWGENGWGQLGLGSFGGTQMTPASVVGDGISTLTGGAKQIVAGGQFTCAINDQNDAVCWGNNVDGRLGNGSTAHASAPVTVQGGEGITAKIAAGNLHSCLVTTSGGVKCWGTNGANRLGRDNSLSTMVAHDVDTLTSGAVDVALGAEHSCALMSDGGVKCWGNDYYGSLGDGSANGFSSQTPVNVALPANTTATAVFAGGYSACALLNTGDAYCWGRNDYGQLGDGTTSNQISPVPVVNATGIQHLAIGNSHACAALADGTAKCWGLNMNGELGDGTTTNSPSGVTVSSLSDVLIVAIPAYQGGGFTCAITQTGEISCWGVNNYANLARGTAGADEPLPAPISNQPDPSISSVARLVTTSLPSGTLSLTAELAATSSHDTSTGIATHTVNPQQATSTSVTTSPSSTQAAQAITMIATVTSPGNAATGTVFFYLDNVYQGSATLNAGTATYVAGPWTSNPSAAPGAGAHQVRAQYAGDTAFLGSTSPDHAHTVTSRTATISLARSPNASTIVGQTLTLTATVGGSPTPTGTVTFKRGTAVLGSASLVAGVARFSTASLAATTHPLTATYSGNGLYGSVSSTTLNHTVLKFTPTVTLTAAPTGSSSAGQLVEFSARVSGNASGSVTFRRGAIVFGTASIVTGVAKLRVSNLPLGSHTIRATYNGNASLNTATSAPLAHVIKAATRTTLAPVTKLLKPGQSVTLTATVAKVTASSAALTGHVAFMRGTSTIRVEPLVNGRATYTGSLPVGQHEVFAVYSGNPAYGASTTTKQFVEVGYARGNEFRVSVATHFDQQKPAVSALDDHAVAVWMGQTQNGGAYGLFARLFDEGGLPDGGEIAVAQPDFTLDNPAVSNFRGTRYAVVWQSHGGGSNGRDIYVRLFDGRSPLNLATRVNTLTANDQVNPGVFSAGDNLIIYWESYNAAKTQADIYARVYNSSGNPLGPEFRVNPIYNFDAAIKPTGARLLGAQFGLPADTGFVIGWLRSHGGGLATPMIQKFDLIGRKSGIAIPIDTVNNTNDLSLEALPAELTVASWSDSETVAGGYKHGDIRTRLIEDDNRLLPLMTVVGGYLFDDVTPKVGKLGAYTQNTYGRSLAFLSSPRGVTKKRVMVQAYGKFGPLLSTPFPLDSGQASTIRELAMGDLGRGWYSLVIWNAFGQDGSQGGIFGRLVAAP